MPNPTPADTTEALVAPIFPGPLAPRHSLEDFDRLYSTFLKLGGGLLEMPTQIGDTEPADPLKPAQRRRVEALKEARDLIASRSLVGTPAPDHIALMSVADYILEG